MAEKPTIRPLGDAAIQLVWHESDWMETFSVVHSMARQISESQMDGIIASIPAYQTLTIQYDPMCWRWGEIAKVIEGLIDHPTTTPTAPRQTIEIPICYESEYSLDLPAIATTHGMSINDVIQLHLSCEYFVQMIGFAPGFPYLSGLPPSLATPRKESPRVIVPKGSVAIGGRQIGIYSVASPGGWNILGRTPLSLFHPARNPPCLLHAGDSIRFRKISSDDYRAMESS